MASWSLSRRIIFRFLCLYFVLYCMPGDGRVNILSPIPGSNWLAKPWTWLMHVICPWVAVNVFHLTGQRTTYFLTGSGDTTLGWVENLLFLVIAAAGTIVWSVLDRQRAGYRGLHGWLRLLVRYTLALTLFAYGFAKIAPLQFQPARFSRLVEPYGEFSSMGVLWSFMGASLPYTMLAGSAEAIGGILLLFRRTTTLGALFSFGVLANVVALNFCYDVPVKLYSTNLLLMCVFLAAPDLRRLYDLLILNRPVFSGESPSVNFQRPALRTAAKCLWAAYCLWVLGAQAYEARQGYLATYVTARHQDVYGLYDVESYQRDGPETAARNAPRKLWFLDQGMGWRTADDKVITYSGKYNASARTLTFNNNSGTITWTRTDPDHLTFSGMVGMESVSARLTRIDTARMRLNSTGFHWVQEFPNNR